MTEATPATDPTTPTMAAPAAGVGLGHHPASGGGSSHKGGYHRRAGYYGYPGYEGSGLGPVAPGISPAAPAPPFWKRSREEYFYAIRRFWWLGLILALPVGAWQTFERLKVLPLYTSTVRLLVEPQQDNVVNIERVVDPAVTNERVLENHLQIIRSRTFRQEVLEQLPEDLAARLREVYARGDTRPVFGIGGGRTKDPAQIAVAAVLANAFGSYRQGTTAIVISATTRDPRISADLANLYANRYRARIDERVRSGNSAATKFLQERRADLEAEIEEGERQLQQIRAETSLLSVDESKAIINQRLQRLNQLATEIRIEGVSLKVQLDEIRSAQASEQWERLQQLPLIAQAGAVTGLINSRRTLLQERELLGLRYLERWPAMVRNQRSLEIVEQQIRDEVAKAVQLADQSLESVHQRASAIAREIKNAEEEATSLDEMSIEFNFLSNQVAANRRLLGQITARLSETMVSQQLDGTIVTVLDPAVPNFSAATPSEIEVLLQAGMLVALLTLAVPIGLEILNSKVHSLRDISQGLGREDLGEVPFRPNLQKYRSRAAAGGGREIASDRREASTEDRLMLEAFRVIHSNLRTISVQPTPKAILVTSTIPAEGKSFISVNLATTFARHGARVLLVDADLRRPSLHERVSPSVKNTRGLLQFAEESWSPPEDPEGLLLDGLIVAILPQVHLMPSGGKTADPTEVLGREILVERLNALKNHYDLIVFDTPPLGVFPDAIYLAPCYEEAVYIVRHNQVARPKIARVLERLDRCGVPVLGIIVNAVCLPAQANYSYTSNYGYYQKQYSRQYAPAEQG